MSSHADQINHISGIEQLSAIPAARAGRRPTRDLLYGRGARPSLGPTRRRCRYRTGTALMSRAHVTMIVHFPPPVGGAALLNAGVCDSLVAAGVDVTRVDVSGPTLGHNRSFGHHPRRAVRNLLGLRRARLAASGDAALYIVPDAGLGAWYTCAHMACAARRYGAVMIHHHSCRYIEDHNRAIAAVATIARDRATHVFETDGQAAAFRYRYGDVPSRVATNAYLVADEAARPPRPRQAGPIRLGHLSNLCSDKGFLRSQTRSMRCAPSVWI